MRTYEILSRMPLLHNHLFRRLYAAQVASLLGSGLLTVALALLAARLAGDDAGVVLGTALTIKMVAYVGMAPVMRAACERFPRATVLIGADAVRLAMVAALPWSRRCGRSTSWCSHYRQRRATFTPTFTATIPTVVPHRDDYTRAVAASRIALRPGGPGLPMLAAALLFTVPPSGIFLVAATGFAASALLVGSVRTALGTATPAAGSAPFHRRATAGLESCFRAQHFPRSHRDQPSCAAVTAPVMVYSVVYVDTELDLGAGASPLLAACGVGITVHRTFADGRPPHHTRSTALAGAVIGCGPCWATTTAHLAGLTYPALLAVWFVIGIATSP